MARVDELQSRRDTLVSLARDAVNGPGSLEATFQVVAFALYSIAFDVLTRELRDAGARLPEDEPDYPRRNGG